MKTQYINEPAIVNGDTMKRGGDWNKTEERQWQTKQNF